MARTRTERHRQGRAPRRAAPSNAKGRPAHRPAAPLDRKLGIQRGSTVALVHAPDDLLAALRGALASCVVLRGPRRSVDLALLFGRDRQQLEAAARGWTPRLAPSGALWLAWPKKASRVETDLTDRSVRDVGLAEGLVDVQVASLSPTWSGLRFVRRRRDR